MDKTFQNNMGDMPIDTLVLLWWPEMAEGRWVIGMFDHSLGWVCDKGWSKKQTIPIFWERLPKSPMTIGNVNESRA